jgi:hypothetical protein
MKQVIAVVKPYLVEKVLEAIEHAPLEACAVREGGRCNLDHVFGPVVAGLVRGDLLRGDLVRGLDAHLVRGDLVGPVDRRNLAQLD